jgi:hypothetical protein
MESREKNVKSAQVLLPEIRGSGRCSEAQADGVPCPDAKSDCQKCGQPSCGCRMAEPNDLGGRMMSDGLLPSD